MAKSQDNGAQIETDHIAQIRDIIFGPQKREYDERFEKVVAELHRLQSDSKAQLDELRTALHQQFSAGLSSLEQDVRDIASKLQAEASAMRKEIERSEKKSGAELADTRTRLQADIRAATDHLSREIDASASAASGRDVSRETLAEMLQEVAMKLKGIDILGELKRATAKKAGE